LIYLNWNLRYPIYRQDYIELGRPGLDCHAKPVSVTHPDRSGESALWNTT
jgi:hypothetical protein